MSMIVRPCVHCKFDHPESNVIVVPNTGTAICLGCAKAVADEYEAYEEREILFGDYEDDEAFVEDVPFS